MNLRLLILAAVVLPSALSAQRISQNTDDRTYIYSYGPLHRKVISVPDIDGYKSLKCDFHMHTSMADAKVTPEERIEEAWVDGLDAVCVSEHIGVHKSEGVAPIYDHNRVQDRVAKAGKKFGLLVIRGVEITRSKPFGHMNMMFIKDCNVFCEERYKLGPDGKELKDEKGHRIPNRETELSDFEAAEKQGAFIQWNHPGWPDKICDMPDFHREMIKAGRIHAVEICNSKEWYPKVLDWFDQFQLPMTANSDAHTATRNYYGDSLRPINIVFAKEQTLEGLKEAMFAGRFVSYFGNMMAGKAELMEALVRKCLQIKVIDAKKNQVEVMNISSLHLEAEWGDMRMQFLPGSGVIATIKPGAQVKFTNCMAGRECLKFQLR